MDKVPRRPPASGSQTRSNPDQRAPGGPEILLQAKHEMETALENKTDARLKTAAISQHNRKSEAAIASGSAKRLLPKQQIHIPPFVSRRDGSITADKAEVMRLWRSDFTTDKSHRPSLNHGWKRSRANTSEKGRARSHGPRPSTVPNDTTCYDSANPRQHRAPTTGRNGH